MTVSMGKDVIMSHISRVIHTNSPSYEEDAVRAAAAIFDLGQLSPVVDTITGEVLGFEWKIVIRKYEKAVKPGESA